MSNDQTKQAITRTAGTLESVVRCPFCGHTNNDFDPETGCYAVGVKTYHSKVDGREMHAAMCEWCGANGPLCDTAQEAMAHFNTPNK